MSSANQSDFAVTFWGVRGTLAAPAAEFQKTGGNTICAQLTCGDRVIIFDSGTGIRELGSKLVEKNPERKLDLFFTHVHYDHVEGVPFFAPFFTPSCTINVWMGPIDGAKGTEDAVKGLMRRPYFPVGPDVFTADVTYRELIGSEKLDLGDGIKVTTAPLNHPGGATGYRVDYKGRSFAFITDTEHVPGQIDTNVVSLISGCDLFAYDCSFTDAEFPEFAGFGHSTWEEGLRLREKSGAGAMLALHHMPFRTDDEVELMEKSIRKRHAESGVAREGLTIAL